MARLATVHRPRSQEEEGDNQPTGVGYIQKLTPEERSERRSSAETQAPPSEFEPLDAIGMGDDDQEIFESEQRSSAWRDVRDEFKQPLWKGGQETTWAKEEAARGENALVAMHELQSAYNRYSNDAEWNSERWSEFVKGKQSGEIPGEQTYGEFILNELWKQVWSEKGLRSQPMIEKARELGDIQSRDPAKFWEDKPEWQTDAEQEIAKGFEAMAGRTEYVGGNRMYATKAIHNAATKIRGKMTDQFIRGREIESTQAALDLKDFLGNAQIQGEQALVALDERRQQFKMQQDQIRSQEVAGDMSFAGTLIAAFISAVAIAGSDERLKTVTGTTKSAAYEYLDAMQAAKYHMPVRENAGMSPDEFGIMAQSLEDSELGSQMVQEMLGVKTVEPNHAVRVTMVAQKELHERLKRLERLAGVKELLDV